MPDVETPVEGWKLIVRGEYLEIPGLHLTKPQVQRLWGMDATTCDELLSDLVKEQFLRRTARDQYARR